MQRKVLRVKGRRIVLKDNTTIENGEAGFSDGFLWLWFDGYTLQQVALMFFDATKTDRIAFQYGEMEDVYEGFTTCRTLMTDASGRVSVCMTKGE